MALLQQLHQRGQTIVMVTHENDMAAYAGRIIALKDGKVIDDSAKL
jgi:ABC-type lipoprotein export system ATPase subunit